VACFVFHSREDVCGILAEDGVECDEWFEDIAPFELIEAPHAVQDCREGRLLDGRQWPGYEGFVGTIKDVFELRELEGLGKNGHLFEEKSVSLLCPLDVDGEGFGGPDASCCDEVAFGEVDRSGQLAVVADADVRERCKGRGRVIASDERRFQHTCAFEQLKFGRQFLDGGSFTAGTQRFSESLFQSDEASGEPIGLRVSWHHLPLPAECIGALPQLRFRHGGLLWEAGGRKLKRWCGGGERVLYGDWIFGIGRRCHGAFLLPFARNLGV
jgi:hypothetical protein